MLRDRLRLWGLNNKNRHGVTFRRRDTIPTANNSDKLITRHHSRRLAAYSGIYPRSMASNESVHNILHTPAETLVLDHVLKGILDWEQHLISSKIACDNAVRDERQLNSLIWNMGRALDLVSLAPTTCGSVMLQLYTTSEAIRNHMTVTCTPLAVLRSVEPLLYLCLLYTSPSPRDGLLSRMPSSA